MSVTTAVDAMAGPIGFDIAQSTDRAQADLLNGLARGLAQMNGRAREMQLAYVAPLLTQETRELVHALAGMIELVSSPPPRA